MSALAKSKKLLTIGLSAIAITAANTSVSYAGFQWTAPATQSRAVPAPMPALPAPQIQQAPIAAPTPVPAPFVAPAAPNIVLDPMPVPQPSVMPGSSVLPQETAYGAAPQPMPSPVPTATPMITTAQPIIKADPALTPRRVRPTMPPQTILPSASYPASQQAAIGNLPQNNIDFVPTYAAPAPAQISSEAMIGTASEPINASAPATLTPGPAVPTPAPVIATPVPSIPTLAVNKDTAPIIPTYGAPAAPRHYAPQPEFRPQPQIATTATPAIVETPMPGQGYIFENAVGFGKDLPLMTAVKQIIPHDYGLSFTAGIPTEINVSWEGGRPWNEVLDLALAPHGLQAVVSGNVVTIQPMPSVAPYYMPSDFGTEARAEQKNVMMAPIIDDTMQPYETPNDLYSQQTAPAPTSILTPAVATSDMAYNAQNDYLTPAAANGGYGSPTMKPMIGAMAPEASPYPPVSPTNPQIYDKSIQFWAAPKDSSLREVLNSWTRKAGVELFWASEYDYPISTAVNIEGNFEEAVQTLLEGLEESEPRPQGRLHPNLPNGPAVLVIETRGIN